MTLLIVAFLGTFGFLCSAGLLMFYRDAVMERLSVIIDQRLGSSSGLGRFMHRKETTVEQIVKPFQNVLPRSAREVSVLQKRLIRAGYRQENAVNAFYGAKVATPLALGIIGLALGSYQFGPVFAFILGAGLGFLLPDFWLSNRIA